MSAHPIDFLGYDDRVIAIDIEMYDSIDSDFVDALVSEISQRPCDRGALGIGYLVTAGDLDGDLHPTSPLRYSSKLAPLIRS